MHNQEQMYRDRLNTLEEDIREIQQLKQLPVPTWRQNMASTLREWANQLEQQAQQLQEHSTSEPEDANTRTV